MRSVHGAMVACVPTAANGAVGNSTHTDTIAQTYNNNNTHQNFSGTLCRHDKKTKQSRRPPRDERPLILAERFHTRLCKSFRKSGTCEYGAFCMFAHGKARLRTVDANVRDGLTTTEAIRAWQRACAAEAAAEELKRLPLETATVGRPVTSPTTAENSASELPSALDRRGHGPISPDTVTAANAGESPLLPPSAHTVSTPRPINTRVYRHNPYGLAELPITVVSDSRPLAADGRSVAVCHCVARSHHTFQHRPYAAVPVSRGPVMLS